MRRHGVRLRRAERFDVEYLAALAASEDVAPFLAFVSPRDADAFLAEIEQASAAPADGGRYVIEVDEEDGASRAGSVAFGLVSRRSRIANLYGLMLDPAFRGRGVARVATELFVHHLLRELDYHRVELECYGYNRRAIRHFERCGFVREGVKRRAYRRGGEWVDGVFLAFLAEDVARRPDHADPG